MSTAALLLCLAQVGGADAGLSPPSASAPISGGDGADAGLPFAPGEQMTYEIHTLGIKSGSAQFNVGAAEPVDGVSVWPILMLARSEGVTETIYPVRDRYVSFWDPQRKVAVEGDLVASENGRARAMAMRFHRDGAAGPQVQVAVHDPKESSSFTHPMPAGAQDIQTAIYWLRTRPLRVGDHEQIPIVAGKKQWTMTIDIDRGEPLDVPAGHFGAVHMRIGTGFSGQLQSRGAVEAWFSDDVRHIPLLFQAELGLGKVSSTLMSYSR